METIESRKVAPVLCLLLLCASGRAAADADNALEPGEVRAGEAPGEQRSLPVSSTRPAWRTQLEASVGLNVMLRTFEFSDPLDPQNPANYVSDTLPAINLGAQIYPLASLGGPLADVGITFDYYRALHLRADLPSHKELLDTTMQKLEVGLQFRWNVLASSSGPTLLSGLGYGWQEFTIHDSSDNPIMLPDLAYQYLWLMIIGAHVPFVASSGFSFGATVRLDYLVMLDAGDMELTDSGGYGTASMGGIEARAGLFFGYKWFEARATFFYRRIWFDFDNSCYGITGCKAAGGALDEYTGLLLNFGFSR